MAMGNRLGNAGNTENSTYRVDNMPPCGMGLIACSLLEVVGACHVVLLQTLGRYGQDT